MDRIQNTLEELKLTNPISVSRLAPNQWDTSQWEQYQLNFQRVIEIATEEIASAVDAPDHEHIMTPNDTTTYLACISRHRENDDFANVTYTIESVIPWARGHWRSATSATLRLVQRFVPDVDRFVVNMTDLASGDILGLEIMHTLNEIFCSWDGVQTAFEAFALHKPVTKLRFLARRLASLRANYLAKRPLHVISADVLGCVPILKKWAVLPSIRCEMCFDCEPHVASEFVFPFLDSLDGIDTKRVLDRYWSGACFSAAAWLKWANNEEVRG